MNMKKQITIQSTPCHRQKSINIFLSGRMASTAGYKNFPVRSGFINVVPLGHFKGNQPSSQVSPFWSQKMFCHIKLICFEYVKHLYYLRRNG